MPHNTQRYISINSPIPLSDLMALLEEISIATLAAFPELQDTDIEAVGQEILVIIKQRFDQLSQPASVLIFSAMLQMLGEIFFAQPEQSEGIN